MGFSFGQAIKELKAGARVSREGWNGKGMYLLLIKGGAVTEAIDEHYGKGWGEKPTPVQDAIYMYTAQGDLVPWVASQTDLLADDWTLAK